MAFIFLYKISHPKIYYGITKFHPENTFVRRCTVYSYGSCSRNTMGHWVARSKTRIRKWILRMNIRGNTVTTRKRKPDTNTWKPGSMQWQGIKSYRTKQVIMSCILNAPASAINRFWIHFWDENMICFWLVLQPIAQDASMPRILGKVFLHLGELHKSKKVTHIWASWCLQNDLY